MEGTRPAGQRREGGKKIFSKSPLDGFAAARNPVRMASWHAFRRCPFPVLGVGIAVVLGAGVPLVARGVSGSGLGTPWIAETGGPEVLQTQSVLLAPDGGRPDPGRLEFELGFATPETPAVGLFYDSVTLSLAQADGAGATILATADAFGLTLAPGGVGGLIPGGTLRISEIPLGEGLLPGAKTGFAYSVVVDLPPAARSIAYRATFDLFDNGDLFVSRTFVTAVPEPAGAALLGAGAAGLGLILLRRNQQ